MRGVYQTNLFLWEDSHIKGVLSGLRPILATKIPLKMMENWKMVFILP